MPVILTQHQIDSYFSTGYLHVRDVYSRGDIDKIRALLAMALEDGTWKSAPHYNEGVTTDIFRTMPELVDLIFTEKYVQIFKDLLGPEMVILPEPAMHRNRFYYWHKDSTFLDEQGETFHWNNDFQAIMAAMYLQDNDDEYGGGLTVVPNTQHGTTPIKRRKDYDKFAYFNFVMDSNKYTADIIRCMRARPSGYFSEYLKHDKELPETLIRKSKELDFNIDF